MERMSENIPAGVTIDVRSSPDSSPLTSANGKTDYMRIGLIVVILLFLGINVFSYLGDFFQRVKEFFTPLLKSVLGSLGYVVTESTKDVTQLTAEGAKLGIDVAAGSRYPPRNQVGHPGTEQGPHPICSTEPGILHGSKSAPTLRATQSL